MSKVKFIPKSLIIFLCLISFVFTLSAWMARSDQSFEFDEGVYLATFKSVDQGFTLYKQTYFSQLPGFFVAIYPGYKLFGSNLEAARLTIFLYSLIGLAGIIWIGWEIKAWYFGFIAIGILYLIPLYTTEILTFHADALPSAFSILSLAAILKYKNNPKYLWCVISVIFLIMAVMIKADLAILPVIILTIFRKSKLKIEKIFGLLILFVGLSLGFILPFGFLNVYQDVINLRLLASQNSSFDPGLFIQYFSGQFMLVGLFFGGILLNLFVLNKFKPYRTTISLFSLWLFSTFLILFLYHPLQPHHLFLLTVPTALFFSFPLYLILKNYLPSKFGVFLILLFLSIVSLHQLIHSINSGKEVLNKNEQQGVTLVQAKTNKSDFIISDDGLITAYSGRQTPPDLVDLSYVRILANNLSSQDFKDSLQLYKPKMILDWTGRINQIKGFDQIIMEFNYQLITTDPDHKAYLLR